MKILYNSPELMNGSKLFSDYVNDPGRTAEFFPSHFRDEASLRRIMDEIGREKRDYGELARILKRQNAALCSGQKVMENIDKLTVTPAFAVVTGQQVGILTGPLYTIYKAMTAVKLAHHLSRKHDAEFVPVFWMESNDHDLEEANHINLLGSDDEVQKLEYVPKQYVPGYSMKDVPVDDGFRDLILDLESRLPNTEFRDEIFGIIRDVYLSSKNLGHGFGRMMARFLGKYGLILLDPSDPEIKNLMSPIFEDNIRSPLKPMEMVNSAGERVCSAGYESQIEKSGDSTCLFIEENSIRRKLFFRDNRFIMDENNTTLAGEELVSILRGEPWRFSPNVALRPVTQDYILPTAVYVAGPGEVSYFAQLQGLYKYLNVIMPIIFPRASLTIVETKVERVMERNNLTVMDLSEHYESLFSRLSRRTAAGKLEDVMGSSKAEIGDVFGRLAAGLTEFDPGLENIVESTRNKVLYQISILAERAYKSQRSRDDVLRSQIKRACMNIYPDGKPQEREFNIVQYLVLHGEQFLDDVMSAIDI